MRLSTFILSTAFAAYQVNCVAVHNWWRVPDGFGDIKEIVSSIRVPTSGDCNTTYWMANGFSYGYMGMQHNSGEERRILFSVWDNGQGSIVDLLDNGKDVITGGFGGEGTGAHGYLRYDWKPEDTVYFKVTADVNTQKNGTTLTGYFSTDEGSSWNLVASFFAQQQLKWLTGLYGFLEDFGYGAGHVTDIREGYYGNATAKNTADKVATITDFGFTHTKPGDTDVWQQNQHIGPNNEIYQRIGGTKDEGIYPPTNPA